MLCCEEGRICQLHEVVKRQAGSAFIAVDFIVSNRGTTIVAWRPREYDLSLRLAYKRQIGRRIREMGSDDPDLC